MESGQSRGGRTRAYPDATVQRAVRLGVRVCRGGDSDDDSEEEIVRKDIGEELVDKVVGPVPVDQRVWRRRPEVVPGC